MNQQSLPFNRPLEDILREQAVDLRQGLSLDEARERLTRSGRNVLPRGKRVSAWEVLLRQFRNLIMLLLAVAAGIDFLLGDLVEGLAVLAVILLNAFFGFVIEFRAERSVEALRQMVKTSAKVLRSGRPRQIAAEEVVPGDVLLLEEGDLVPADARLAEADNLAVDEALLTGESQPVGKTLPPLAGEIPLAERRNMVFMGTAVTRGNGAAVVVATGAATEMGRISDLLVATGDEPTPLEKRLERTGRFLIVLTLVITALIGVAGILGGQPVTGMLKTAIALAIAAVPEGLPAVATVTLAIGMRRMARRRALVRSLPAVETLGSTTIICTDKTGTLTESQMTVQEICLPGRRIQVGGTGYAPVGEFSESGRPLAPERDADLIGLLRAALLCSNASLVEEKGAWSIIGDPTEGALVTAARKAGLEQVAPESGDWPRLEELPFDSEARFMAVRCRTPDGGEEVFVKGAPEVVLGWCTAIHRDGVEVPLAGEDENYLLEENRRLAAAGLGVLAVARQRPAGDKPLPEAVAAGLTLLGLAGILDPPRPDVAGVIAQATRAGIRTIMVTGDQAETARFIASRVGIADPGAAVTVGSDLDRLSPAQLAERIGRCSIFARVSPRHKLDIIAALKAGGQIAAMTGDGVNDAPALKKADIGVAMGQRGTVVARQAADMVLLDDRYATIIEAVRQGRVIFDNIRKFIHYLLSCNLSEVLLIFFAILMGLPSPLTALQILWLNLVTDVFPALAMGFESPEPELMTRPPRDPASAIVDRRFKVKIGVQGLVLTLGPLAAFMAALGQGYSLSASRTVVFMSLVLVQLFHVFNVRRQSGLGIDTSLFRAFWLWGAFVLTLSLQMLALYLPILRQVLHTGPLTAGLWLIVVGGALGPVVLLQLGVLGGRLRHRG